ncbi:MAG: hypothetical protein EOL87_11085 [Spartobacteria bacterium]|nr:hypothetical protein [Spartobacteria bacterium]
MKNIRKQVLSALLLAVMSVSVVNAQDDIQKARKLRANAAYLEMKGKTREAIAQYEESLTYHKDDALLKKVAELKGDGVVAAVAEAVVSAGEREMAGEVYSRLDVTGDILMYFNAASIVQPLREQIKELAAAVVESTENPDESMTDDVASSVDPVLDWLGFYAVQAAGFSLAPAGGEMYRAKSYTLVDASQRDRALWRLCGSEPRDMQVLKFYPEETELLEGWTFSIETLLDVVREGLQKFGPEGADQMLDMQFDQIRQNMGIDISRIIASLSDELAVGLTLSPDKTMSFPMSEESVIEFPDPGLLMAIKVKDDTLQTALLDFMAINQIPYSQQKVGGTVVYSLNIPLQLPVRVEPSMAVKDGVFLLSVIPETITSALASYDAGGSLMKSEKVKTAFANLPVDKLNGFAYVSPAFCKAYTDIELEMMKAGGMWPGDDSVQKLMTYVEKLMNAHGNDVYASIAVKDVDGALISANMRTGGMNPVVSAIMSPLAFGVALGITAAAEQAEMEQKYECMANLQLIMEAKDAWAVETNVAEDASPTWDDLMPYLPEGVNLVCPAGGEYTINPMNRLPACSVPEHDLTEWYGEPEMMEEDVEFMDEEVVVEPMEEEPMEEEPVYED